MGRSFYPLIGVLCMISCGGDNRGASAPAASPTSPTVVYGPPPSAIRYTVSGTVRDPDGRPIESVGLFAIQSKWAGGSARTDARGMYSMSLLEGGYLFSVSHPSFQDISQTLTLQADTTLDLTLVPGISLGGIVSEFGVAGRLHGALVEIVSGPNAGLTFVTREAGTQSYGFGGLVPGHITVRASKSGYETVEQRVDATRDATLNFTMRWAYGTCLQSVSPLAIGPLPSAGGTGEARINASTARRWTATSDVPWIEVLSSSSQTGSSDIAFRVLASGPTDVRTGAVMIRCDGAGGQNIWVTQLPQCRLRFDPGAGSAAAAGGGLRLSVINDTPGCRWQARSEVDWMHTAGIASGSGHGEFVVGVRPNQTGELRTGHILVGEARWPVMQQP